MRHNRPRTYNRRQKPILLAAGTHPADQPSDGDGMHIES